MNTDRDLLEMAAKAAGLKSPRFIENTSWGTGISHGEGDAIYLVWNPITDDGDALRLAVKLRLLWDEMELFDLHFETDSKDPYAATRLAIVRAAAEIGKEMK